MNIRLILTIGFLLLASVVSAQTFGDLRVLQTPQWFDGVSSQGYAELHYRITNEGSAVRTVTISLSTDREYVSASVSVDSISRTVEVPSLSTVSLSLMLPPIAVGGGSPVLSIDGVRQPQRLGYVSDTYSSGGYYGRSSRNHRTLVFSRGFDANSIANTNTFSKASTAPQSVRGVAVPPAAEWPTNWLGYTRAYGIAISEADWLAVTPEAQKALHRYARAGGLLIFAGEVPTTIRDQLDDSVQTNGISNYGLGRVALVDTDWPSSQAEFEQTIAGWTRLNSLYRIEEDLGDAESSLSMLEGRSIPGRTLFAILLVFSILAGPVNLIVLIRLRRPTLLFLTAPVSAVVVSSAVFAYGFLHDGIDTDARSRAVWFLDQGSREAIGITHLALYAPLPPRGGIRFDQQTMVNTLPPERDFSFFEDSSSVTINQSDGQRFTQGLIRPRIPSHISTVSQTTRRERLLVERADDGTLRVNNGLGASISRVLFDGGDGRVYEATEIADGGTAPGRLTELVTSSDQEFSRWLRANLASRAFDDFERTTTVPPRSYIAILDGELFTSPEIGSLRSHDARAVVVGTFGGEP